MLSLIFTMIAAFGISIVVSSRLVNWGIPTTAAITLDKLKAGYYVFNYAHGGHYHFVLPHDKDYLKFNDPVVIMVHNGKIHLRLPNDRYIHDSWTTQMDLFTRREYIKFIEWFYDNKEKFDSEDHEDFIKRVTRKFKN